MASNTEATSSSLSNPHWNYDVFLSFRGQDTRSNFVDHLYFALEQNSIFTFKDDMRLERGKPIAPDLLKSIEESRFAIIVFSKNYASSSWCLDEVAKIMECSKTMGQTVFPVFYEVDPSDVRKQTGDFGKAFAKHKGSQKVDIWRTALAEAAGISGWDVNNTFDGNTKCIQQIVSDIFCILGDTSLSAVENLFGIESRVEKVNSLLSMGSDDVRFVGIWGLSGTGKTTTARAIFERIRNQFQGDSFLRDVRDAAAKHDLAYLQKKLLSEILKVTNLEISNSFVGVQMIRRRLRSRRVLIVLDDVDSFRQVEALAGKNDWFGPGSRIIITTTDKQILVGHNVSEIHEMTMLNDDEAIQLFSWKAFKKIHPPNDYEELTYSIVNYVGGLPLALKILGSTLRGRDKAAWRSEVDRLAEKGPRCEIRKEIKIGFDGLEDTEKEIFLDIACFFNGKKKDYITRILNSCNLHPDIGISVLIQKSLIIVDQNRIWMHPLVQEEGWHIVRRSSPEEPGERSRLWLIDDIKHVFKKGTGTKKVKGIVLDFLDPEEIPIRTKAINVSGEGFKNMNRLRLLIIYNACIPQGLEYLSDELRWLTWFEFPSKSLPPSFQPEKLVGLEMHHSRITEVWKGKKELEKLKYMDFSHSQKLIRTPDLTEVPYLEELILEGCTGLKEVHPSVGHLTSLVLMNLKNCNSLRSLPNTICMLKRLKELILSGCSKLDKLPEDLGSLECLEELYSDETSIQVLPSSIGQLTNLRVIVLKGCKNLTSLPTTICMLEHLRVLDLCGCSKLDNLAEVVGNLQHLEELVLEDTAITQLPHSI